MSPERFAKGESERTSRSMTCAGSASKNGSAKTEVSRALG